MFHQSAYIQKQKGSEFAVPLFLLDPRKILTQFINIICQINHIMLAALKKGKTVLGSFRAETVSKAVRGYHDNIIDHYENPRNVGSLDKNKKLVGTGERAAFASSRYCFVDFDSFAWCAGLVGAPACGDVMKLQFETDENGIIIDAKFKTFGCGSAIGTLPVLSFCIRNLPVILCSC